MTWHFSIFIHSLHFSNCPFKRGRLVGAVKSFVILLTRSWLIIIPTMPWGKVRLFNNTDASSWLCVNSTMFDVASWRESQASCRPLEQIPRLVLLRKSLIINGCEVVPRVLATPCGYGEAFFGHAARGRRVSSSGSKEKKKFALTLQESATLTSRTCQGTQPLIVFVCLWVLRRALEGPSVKKVSKYYSSIIFYSVSGSHLFQVHTLLCQAFSFIGLHSKTCFLK